VTAAAEKATLIWDLPTRLFHWSLVAAVAASWWTAKYEESETHAAIGYAVLGLILFRLIWGIAGSETSQLAALAAPPLQVVGHLQRLFRKGKLQHEAGHNAAGGYAVLLLLACITIQAVTGLFLYDEELFWGPLNDLVSGRTAERLRDLHRWNFNVLQGLVVFHLLAILFYGLAKGLNLVRPMVSGRAFLPPGSSEPHTAPISRALAAAAASGAIIWWAFF